MIKWTYDVDVAKETDPITAILLAFMVERGNPILDTEETLEKIGVDIEMFGIEYDNAIKYYNIVKGCE